MEDILSEFMPTQEEMATHFSYLQNVSFNDIVPDQYQHRLMAIDFAFTVGFFEMGDIANDCLEAAAMAVKTKRIVINQNDVFAAVGYFCRRSARTVRYYAETCRFYPREVRKEFEDLSFSYFVLARKFGERWRDVLEFAQENIHMNVDQVGNFFSQREQPADSGVGQESPSVSDEEIAQGTDRALRSVLSGLASTSNQLARILRTEQIEPDIKNRVYRVLDEISDIVQDIKDTL